MKAAAKQLEFERAAALRDEIQQIRLRVLEQDASITVGRAAERAAATRRARAVTGAADRARGRRSAAEAAARSPAMEVTSVDGAAGRRGAGRTGRRHDRIDEGTVADWLPGIRDEHEDDGGWQARWLDRPTWDHTVTPNVDQADGTRSPRPRTPTSLSGHQAAA